MGSKENSMATSYIAVYLCERIEDGIGKTESRGSKKKGAAERNG